MTKEPVTATRKDIDDVLQALGLLQANVTAETAKTGKRIDSLAAKTEKSIDALAANTEKSIDALAANTEKSIDALASNINNLGTKTERNIDALAAKTRGDIDDVLQVLDIMMTKIDDRFNTVEANVAGIQKQTQHILNHLDNLEKRMEISEDERQIMAHQLSRLHDWVEQAAKRIDVTFAH